MCALIHCQRGEELWGYPPCCWLAREACSIRSDVHQRPRVGGRGGKRGSTEEPWEGRDPERLGCCAIEARRVKTFRRKVTSQDVQRCGPWKVKSKQRHRQKGKSLEGQGAPHPNQSQLFSGTAPPSDSQPGNLLGLRPWQANLPHCLPPPSLILSCPQAQPLFLLMTFLCGGPGGLWTPLKGIFC